jgi:predicted nucleic-acid-binding Zn-ribbon protein
MQGFCPNCNMNLADDENVILTEESKIFKGHNAYCMCTHCGYVMVYNKERDLIFSLDRFKDDEDIVNEIYELLNDVTNNGVDIVSKDSQEEVQTGCSGNCATCSGCSGYKPQVEESIKEGDLLAVNIKTGEMSIVHQQHLDLINVNDYEFFELNKVIVERVVSYKIQRM